MRNSPIVQICLNTAVAILYQYSFLINISTAGMCKYSTQTVNFTLRVKSKAKGF